MSTPADALTGARHQATVAALSLSASLAADPSAALDALAAIDPDGAEAVAELIAERDDTTPQAITGKADLYRLNLLTGATVRKAAS